MAKLIPTQHTPGHYIPEKSGQGAGQAGPLVSGSAQETPLSAADRARFEKKVDRTGGPHACHPYLKAAKNGYGRFLVKNKELQAHRVAWSIAHGTAMPANLETHQVCNNRGCCNPAHLELVTHSENVARIKRCEHSPVKHGFGRGCRAAVRIAAHKASERVDPVPADLCVVFLEWVWVACLKRRNGIAVDATSSTRKALFTFLRQLGEFRAVLALRLATLRWSEFSAFAAREYGQFRGDASLAPSRPLLEVIAKNPGPVVNFWNRHPEERERRLAVSLENLSRATRRPYGEDDDQ